MSLLTLLFVDYVSTHPALTPEIRQSRVCSISPILAKRKSGLNQTAPELRSTWVTVPVVSCSKGRFTGGGANTSIIET